MRVPEPIQLALCLLPGTGFSFRNYRSEGLEFLILNSATFVTLVEQTFVLVQLCSVLRGDGGQNCIDKPAVIASRFGRPTASDDRRHEEHGKWQLGASPKNSHLRMCLLALAHYDCKLLAKLRIEDCPRQAERNRHP